MSEKRRKPFGTKKLDWIQACNSYHVKPPRNYFGTGINIKSVLCMPVMTFGDEKGEREVMAVVEIINKKSDAGFTTRDEEILAAICSHITVSLTDDEEKSFKTVIDMCRSQIRGILVTKVCDLVLN